MASTSASRGPLSGYKIIEIAGIGPGPFAAMMLSDMGAEVVRVERVQAVRDSAGSNWDVMQRGRKNVAIDLKHADGVEALLQLVEHADALIEGFRPGVMERLGVGPDVCLARNKKLVFGRMTGWGQDGPYASNIPPPPKSPTIFNGGTGASPARPKCAKAPASAM